MNIYTLESFITFCDDMMIANESFSFKSIKDTIVNIFNRLVDLIESKVRKMKDSKIKNILLRLLNRAKRGLSKSKSLNENDKDKVDELKTEAEEIKEEYEEVVEEEVKNNNDNDTTYPQRKKIKIANPVDKEIFSDVKECCEKNDVKGLIYIFVDSLDVDPTFLTYQKDYEYAKKHCDRFPEQHKELTKIESDKSKWNEDYWVKLKVDYTRNGSDERLQHMREVAKVIKSDKIERLRKERLQRAFIKK